MHNIENEEQVTVNMSGFEEKVVNGTEVEARVKRLKNGMVAGKGETVGKTITVI